MSRCLPVLFFCRNADDPESIINPLAPKDEEEFIFNHVGLTTKQAEDLAKVHGLNCLPEKIIPKWYIFCEQLWQPMPVSLSFVLFMLM